MQTQPLMYQKIKKHPTPRKLYADVLIDKNESDIETATQLVNEYRDALDRGEVVVKSGAQWHCTLLTGLLI